MKIKESAKCNPTCIFFYGPQYYNSITFTADPCYDYINGRRKLGSAALWHKAFLNNKWLENIYLQF